MLDNTTKSKHNLNLNVQLEHFRISWILTRRWLRELAESPVGIVVFLLAEPLIWLILFGTLFQAVLQLPGFPTNNYYGFIVPAIIVMTTLSYFSLGGACIIHDIQSGFIHKMWSAPIKKLPIVTGRITLMVLLNVFQTLVILIIAFIFGVRINTGIFGILGVLLISILFTTGLTAFSMGLAFILKGDFPFSIITTFTVLPLLFLSNAFLPLNLMPTWMQFIAKINVITPAVNTMRDLVITTISLQDFLFIIGGFIIFDFLAIIFAVYIFRKKFDEIF